MNLDSLILRPLTRDELDLAIDWAAAEGWNPGLHDADVFWNTDPEGFVGAELNGELVATGSIVSYGGCYGFMGFFIVRQDLRGKGIGTKLWFYRRDRLHERLQDGKIIEMDGVFDMQDWYAKGGFAFSHRDLRMEGVGASSPEIPGILSLKEVPFEVVASYDCEIFGCSRDSFLGPWISMHDASSLGYLQDGRLKGIGTIRACREGYKIGPLFADDPGIADALFRQLSSTVAGQPIWLDIPDVNQAAVALAQTHGLEEVFGCARMSYGGVPDIPWRKVYGITTFELG
ncbi:MAG: GNAT family N-acetyltransferase [Verrucomicrobiota bacterium]